MPVSVSELAQLARDAQAGDAAALESLLKELHRPVYYTALKMLRNAPDAEDAAQEVFVKILEGLPQLRDPMTVQAWAGAIARNTCKNHLKKSQSHIFREEDGEDGLADLPEESEDASPDRYMDMLAKREIIMEMINALPEKQNLAVHMYYYEGRSIEEIARFMEVSEGTVKSRLSSARARLKTQVEEEERKGNKLYVIFPFLGRLLREDAEATQLPPLPVTQTQIAAAAAGYAAAESVGASLSTGAADRAAADPAGKAAAAAAKGGVSLPVKIAACVTAAAVLAGAAVGLPRLLPKGEPTPAQTPAASAPTEATAVPAETMAAQPTEETAEPTPEAALDPSAFDPEAMLGQSLSAMIDIAGEPSSRDGNYCRWDSGDGSYDFAMNVTDSETIREIMINSGPPLLGLRFGDSAEAAQAALAGLGDPAGVHTRDAGGGQTTYSASTSDYTRLYQVGCIDGMVINLSIHDMS